MNVYENAGPQTLWAWSIPCSSLSLVDSLLHTSHCSFHHPWSRVQFFQASPPPPCKNTNISKTDIFYSSPAFGLLIYRSCVKKRLPFMYMITESTGCKVLDKDLDLNSSLPACTSIDVMYLLSPHLYH